MLIKLGIRYGSKESINIINSIFKLIATTAVETSLQLAKLEGCYPMCNKEALIESSFIKALELPTDVLEDIRKFGLFNSQLLTCAPTGSIGTMLQTSTGVEPNFAFSFTRRTVSLNKEETSYSVDADIVRKYKEAWGNVDILPDFFVASHDIDWQDRIKIQSALQNWIDASISSTINLSEDTTIEEVANIYMEAWKHGLKGVTIWRDNCNRQGILTTEEKKVEITPIQLEADHNGLKRGEIIKAEDNCIGLKRTLITGCGSLHATAYFDPDSGELRECYLSKGSTGGCHNFMIGLSRMISLAARGGIGLESILDQLKSCGVCSSYAVRSATKKDTSKGSCCPVAVGNALKEMYTEMQEIVCRCSDNSKPIELESKLNHVDNSLEECPNCHEKTLAHIGGCLGCHSCGYSKCN